MKKRIIILLPFLLLITGLVFFLIFSINFYHNEAGQYQAIEAYITAVEKTPDKSDMLAKAENFNILLSDFTPLPTNPPKILLPEYHSSLDIANGMIGYISVPDANVLLPIYHGSDEKTMMIGAGHIEGSSFPIEGDSVHSIIIGHRGLNDTRLFFDLGRVEIGEKFTVYVLNKSCTYQVYSIETVLPHEIQSLMIQEGKNRCSLVTCTPYGSESHRLLIHGELTDMGDADSESALKAANMRLWIYRAVIALEILIIVIIAIVPIRIMYKSSKIK